MQNVLDDLTIPDILEDNNKNLCNLLASPDDDDGEITILCDSLYYTETDFADYIKSNDIQNNKNVTIISLNIANLLSKLQFFKVFIENKWHLNARVWLVTSKP